MPERFRLSKWYLDCVGAGGEALIAYWAELRWRKLALKYASVMVLAGGRLDERSTLRPGAAPRIGGGKLEWACDALRTTGVWTAPATPPLEHLLFREGDGAVKWRCLQPLARAEVRCRDRVVVGSGYTEYLELTLAPWALPIDELRWGRAHLGERSVVWVDWTGAPARRLVLLDSRPIEGLRVSDEEIAMAGRRLALSGRRPIREGPLMKSTVGAVPGIRQALSRAGLLMDEHKWISDATLDDGATVLRGTALHERVTWR